MFTDFADSGREMVIIVQGPERGWKTEYVLLMAKKILIVDDSKAIRLSIRFVLEQNNFQVLDAEDGIDALAKLKQEAVDLIITDADLPDKNGITFIRELQANEAFKLVPIIALTTESQNTVLVKENPAGAAGWIVKPFSTDKLLAAVRKVL